MEETKVDKKAAPRFVRKKTLRTTLQEVSQQMYVRNKELADTNRMLSLLRTVDALALESHENVKVICQQVTDAVAESTEYPFVGLFTREAARHDEFGLFGLSGTGRNGRAMKDIFDDAPYLDEDSVLLANEALRGTIDVQQFIAMGVATELRCTIHELRAFEKQLPVKSLYAVKLIVRQRLVGMLVVGFFVSEGEIADSDKALLDRLAGSIGVALDNKLLFEENQRVLMQLKRTNAKLKSLDETKDEFISMASHQLRTPLTAIKGYVSMVLEGDAGELNENQYKLLDQAYTSSQRMVYLIADLLNLSRLRTGKFVIDASTVNIADVISGEIDQLRETAASRSLTIVYDKPAAFPSLRLDETKIQQVLMNLIDNAIYYTPSGGKIDIRLKKLKDAVEFTVKDNGIGVPKSEQRHLFSKFYRAGNARKARPDGTGIGLFMAKKVIVAHGGTLVFESKEGHGSTFGFRLPLQKDLEQLKDKPAGDK